MFQWEISNCEFTAIQDSSHGKRSSKSKCNIYFFPSYYQLIHIIFLLELFWKLPTQEKLYFYLLLPCFNMELLKATARLSTPH